MSRGILKSAICGFISILFLIMDKLFLEMIKWLISSIHNIGFGLHVLVFLHWKYKEHWIKRPERWMIKGCADLYSVVWYKLVKDSPNSHTHTHSDVVRHYYQDNVFPSEVQLDIFCHENLHDFINCFYPEMCLPLLKVRWVLWLHEQIRSACFDPAFVLFENVIYSSAHRLMNTHTGVMGA